MAKELERLGAVDNKSVHEAARDLVIEKLSGADTASVDDRLEALEGALAMVRKNQRSMTRVLLLELRHKAGFSKEQIAEMEDYISDKMQEIFEV